MRFVVKGGGERQSLKLTLKPVFARVTVTSVPAGATVWADDRELGTTPLETELDAGRYTLAIVHPEFRRFESPITVVAGQPLAVGPVELGMPDGRLVVQSRPAGADVSIGGRYRGRTPLTVSVPPGMPQDVLLTLAGHAPATQIGLRREPRRAAPRRGVARGARRGARQGRAGRRDPVRRRRLARPGEPDAVAARGAARLRGAQERPRAVPRDRHAAGRPDAGGRVRAEDRERGARRRHAGPAGDVARPGARAGERRALHHGQPAARAGPPLERDRARRSSCAGRSTSRASR